MPPPPLFESSSPPPDAPAPPSAASPPITAAPPPSPLLRRLPRPSTPVATARRRLLRRLTASLSSLAARLDSDLPSDEDSLRPLEKEAKDRIKFARALIFESKESFDTQLKIQKLRDTIFVVQEQLHRAKKLGALTNRIAAGVHPTLLGGPLGVALHQPLLHPSTSAVSRLFFPKPPISSQRLPKSPLAYRNQWVDLI